MELPKDFIQQMQEMLGADEYKEFHHALTQVESPTSIRINPKKKISPPVGSNTVPWCSNGYYLSERPQFTLDPLFHAGCYYVQEASSMYLSEALHQISKIRELHDTKVLDLCAAPGGKSTLLLSQLPEDALLICNEVVRNRAQILRENIIKWGYPNVAVTSNEASDFQPLGALFDIILCDAPCSGEGMFRKDTQSINEWSLANVTMCQERQRHILTDIWPCLRTDGILIYSTCTYNKKENEENVEWICKQLGAELLDSRRFMPHKTKGEGLFMAILKKTSPADNHNPVFRHSKKKQTQTNPTLLSKWFLTSEPYTLTFETNNTYYAFPQVHAQTIEQLRKYLHIIHYGIQVANIKGKDKLQPSHSLAMSNHLNPNAFPTKEVDIKQALSYLRTEALTLLPDTPRGYVLLTHQQHPLGFVNNLGSRANNLYPSEWRIRMQ